MINDTKKYILIICNGLSVMRKPSSEEVKSHTNSYRHISNSQSSSKQKSNNFIFMICCFINIGSIMF